MSARTLRWRALRLPMRHRFAAAHGAIADREGVLLEVTDADGCRGFGEASPLPSFGGGTAHDVLAMLEAHGARLLDAAEGSAGSERVAANADATQPHSPFILSPSKDAAAGRAGNAAAERAGRPERASSLAPGTPGLAALRCALDVATLDLEARHAGVTVAALLTGERGAAARGVHVNAVIGDGPPDEVARFGREAGSLGYRVLKVKVGAAPLAEDVLRIAELRAACPDTAIRLDANGAWDERTALAAVEAFAPLRIDLLEQPVAPDAVDALARVHAASAIAIAADEAVHDASALARILEARAVDVVVLKPMLLGGLRPAYAIACAAAARGIGAVVTTTFDSSIGTAASLHLACALDHLEGAGAGRAHGLGTGEHLADDVVARTLVAHEGWLALPAGAGLGVAPDGEPLERVACGPWSSARG